jgi:hypothetical protein
MPVCTLNILSLNTSLSNFLSALAVSDLKPLVVARVVRWIILPSKISTAHLLGQNIHWDILLVHEGQSALPKDLTQQITAQWTVAAGIPSRLVSGFHDTNEKLLYPKPEDIPRFTGSLDNPRIASSSQNLELTDELLDWSQAYSAHEGRGAVSMLNLLAFKPGLKDEYLKYGKAFADSTGSRRGGIAKLVGKVISCSSTPEGQKVEWDEIALAHYPSIRHFADMIASDDYQEANLKYRVGSLEDTFILCTTELDLPVPKSKL